MNKQTIYRDYDYDSDEDSDSDEEEVDIYYTDDNERKYSWKLIKEEVILSKLVERGHFHVLKYLHEELHYFLGLQRYCKCAIEYGKLEILDWLHDIGIMNNNDLHIVLNDHFGDLKTDLDYCECAIKSGNVQSLKWLLETGGYDINYYKFHVLANAIESKSTEMIQHCFDLGYSNLNNDFVEDAMKSTESIEVFRKMYELGYEFNEIKKFCDAYKMEDNFEIFEIIKFLRSISVPWCVDIMKDIVTGGTLEMIQYAHEDGCPWTTHGEEYYHLLRSSSLSVDKLNYLIANGCILDYKHSSSSNLMSVLIKKKELGLLDYVIGKNSDFDNRLFRQMFKSSSNPWFEGLSYLLQKGKDVQNFTSLEEVFHIRHDIDEIKYFHSLGLPWCLDSARNTLFLSQIACYVDLDDVKWVYANGCKGGNLVPYVKEEWKGLGIRNCALWKANRGFFAENGLLDDACLEKIGLKQLDPENIQEIGDAQLTSLCLTRKWSFFEVDFCSLRNLVDHGFKFSSESEQASVCKTAYVECCCKYSENSVNEDYRKRLALFVGMGVRDL